MNNFWICKKIFKNNMNKARLWNLMTTCKRKKNKHFQNLQQKKNTMISIYCKQKTHGDL